MSRTPAWTRPATALTLAFCVVANGMAGHLHEKQEMVYEELQEAPVLESAAAEDGRFTLPELVEITQAINPSLAEAVAEIETAVGQAIQVGLYPNPTINQASPQNAGSTSQYNGFVTQEIVTKGKLRRSRAAAERAVQQAELAYVTTRFTVLTDVRQKFYTSLASQTRVEILTHLVEIALRSRDASEKRERGGEGTRADVLLLTIELERAQVGLKNAEALLLAAKQQLASAAGNPLLVIPRVEGDLTYELPDFEFAHLRDNMTNRNAQVVSAEVEIEKNRILLGRAIVQPCPNIFLMGGYQYNAGFTPVHNGIYQVTLPIPVFDRNQGNIRSARANISKAVQGVGRVKNTLSEQLADALGRYRAARQLADRFEEQIIPKASQTQAMTQEAYQRGEFDFLRLLQAQKTLVETQLSYVDAQENRWMAAAEIAGLLQSENFPAQDLISKEGEGPVVPCLQTK